MFGSVLAWPVSDAFGRKPALMLGGVPAFTGWIMISVSWIITNSRGAFLGVILTGRLLTGISVGWLLFSVSVSSCAKTSLIIEHFQPLTGIYFRGGFN